MRMRRSFSFRIMRPRSSEDKEVKRSTKSTSDCIKADHISDHTPIGMPLNKHESSGVLRSRNLTSRSSAETLLCRSKKKKSQIPKKDQLASFKKGDINQNIGQSAPNLRIHHKLLDNENGEIKKETPQKLSFFSLLFAKRKKSRTTSGESVDLPNSAIKPNSSFSSHKSLESLTSHQLNKSFDNIDTYIIPNESEEGAFENSLEDLIAVKDALADEQCPSIKKHISQKEELVGGMAEQEYPFYCLDVVLKDGHDLVVKDSCGTSDPYVKFKIAGKQCYKSRIVYKNLNPNWNEKFTIPIEDIYNTVQVKVFDYDRGFTDDAMGGAYLDPSTLTVNHQKEVKLELSEKGKNGYMGFITLLCTLLPKSQKDKEAVYTVKYFCRSMRSTSASLIGSQDSRIRHARMQAWSSVVTLVLLDAENLQNMSDHLVDPYVKLKLANEKFKSKYKSKTVNPRWMEQFEIHMFDELTSHLEVNVCDHDIVSTREELLGKYMLDLSTLSKEKTHHLRLELEGSRSGAGDGANSAATNGGILNLLVTISGLNGLCDACDNPRYVSNEFERKCIQTEFNVKNSVKQINSIGWLQITVIKAEGLASADIGGKSDPYCVLHLDNERLQTRTEYKTLNPVWNKCFVFEVKDLHSLIDINVYDEDRDRKNEFLGRVLIPVLTADDTTSKWYQLKDKKLLRRAKGAIYIKTDMIYNIPRAVFRTFNPREDLYVQPEVKFKRTIMKRNIERVSNVITSILEITQYLDSCFEWHSTARSVISFMIFLVVTWNFEIYMIPLMLLLIFAKNLLFRHVTEKIMKDRAISSESTDFDDEDEDDEDREKEEKRSFKEKLQSIQEVCLQVQQGMDASASLAERIKNSFNWTVPWLSWLMVTGLIIIALILYCIPLRYLCLVWGINKFTKKLRAPDAVPNNELLDYLSRVPSDVDLVMRKHLKVDSSIIKKKKN